MKRISFSLLALVTLSAGLFYVFVPEKKEEAASVVKKEVTQKEEYKALSSKPNEGANTPERSYSKPKSSTKPKEEVLPITHEVSSAVEIPANEKVEEKEVILAPQANETVKKESLSASVPATPCSDKKIEATLVSKACQKNQSNGSIEIQLPSSRPHVHYSLDKHHFAPDLHFRHLSAGEYNLYAKEGECITSLGAVTIKSTSCISEYEKTYSPDLDPAWPIPIMEDETASFKIVDKTGNVIFESKGFEPSGATWSGNNANRGPAALGVYKVFLHYPSGESCVNSVTLFR